MSVHPALAVVAADVRRVADALVVEEEFVVDVVGCAVEAVARGVVAVLGVDPERAWRDAFGAISAEYLLAPDE